MKFLIISLLFVTFYSAHADEYEVLRDQAEGYAQVTPGRAFQFPADHLPHDEFRIEWWYVTANLQDEQGLDYGVHWTLFRQTMSTEANPGGWSSNQLWMAHAALHTPDGHLYQQRFARGGIGQAGVAITDNGFFNAWLDDWELLGEGPVPFPGQLRFALHNNTIQLRLNTQTPWVLQGDRGYSVKSERGQASYYYSQPHIEVSGKLISKGQTITLSGQGWLDREWSSQPLAEDQSGWDWISLHLDDGHALMVYRLRQDDGAHWLSGSWIRPDGQSTTLSKSDISIEPLRYYEVQTDKKEKRSLPLEWHVKLINKGLQWKVSALSKDNWLDTAFPYWEGPVRAQGSSTGVGYLELTGY